MVTLLATTVADIINFTVAPLATRIAESNDDSSTYTSEGMAKTSYIFES